MPCYQVNLFTVEFKASNLDRLEQSAKQLNLSFRVTADKKTAFVGRIELDLENEKAIYEQSYSRTVNTIKRKYSELTLQEIAVKKRWLLKKNKESKTSYKLRRL